MPIYWDTRRGVAVTIHVYTRPGGCVAVVRQHGREVWRSPVVPVGRGGLAWAMAERWRKGAR